MCWSNPRATSRAAKSFDHLSFAQPASPMFGQPTLIIHIFSHSSAAFDDWYNVVFLWALILLDTFLLLPLPLSVVFFGFPWWIHICPLSQLALVLNDGSTKAPYKYGFFCQMQKCTDFLKSSTIPESRFLYSLEFQAVFIELLQKRLDLKLATGSGKPQA